MSVHKGVYWVWVHTGLFCVYVVVRRSLFSVRIYSQLVFFDAEILLKTDGGYPNDAEDG